MTTREKLAEEYSSPTEEIMNKLYGPKFCEKCQKVQPLKIYQLERSQFVKTEGLKVTAGFTGARVCSVCLTNINLGDSPKGET